MSRIITISGVILLLLSLVNCAEKTAPVQEEATDIYEGIEFDMPKVIEPTFPDFEVSIKDFGAKGDGLFDNSEAINSAIASTSEKGGGKVIIPRGIWFTGPIALKSNVNLHLQAGALVQFSADFDKYPLIETSFEGLDTYRCLSPIYGKDLTNIAITGTGVIDGSGDAWRFVKSSKLTESQWKTLVKSGGVLSEDGKTWYPSEKSKNGHSSGNFNVPDLQTKEEFEQIKDFLRPVMVSLISCKNVLLDGPTFQNSPAWNLHPLMSEHVTIRNLTIRNPWYSQNGDGLDLESCKNVIIYNNSFDVGDDAICIKSGKNEDGLRRGIPTENVIIKNNTVYHAHGGFVVGSEMSGGVKNVHVSNCTFIGTDCGLRFKSTRGRGGVVENIFISNIDMIGVPAEAIRFNLYYGGESPIASDGTVGKEMVKSEPMPVDETTPSFRNIFIKNVTATGAGIAGFFQGLPEMKLQNIQMENMMIEAERGMTFIDSDGIQLKNVTVLQGKGIPVTVFNGMNISVESCAFNEAEFMMRVYGEESKDIRVSGNKINDSDIFMSEEIAKGALKIDGQ